MVQLKGRPMFDHEFEPPLFKLEHMLKYVRHTLAEARELGVELRMGALAERLYSEADAGGHGGQDFAAIVTAPRPPPRTEADSRPQTWHSARNFP
jgi:3-hydroxyisobutyrate dehydrogenase-like beta-hydroxyacid dehydrogenase